jgi:hypothetical protein
VKRLYYLLCFLCLFVDLSSQENGNNLFSQTRTLAVRDAKFVINYDDVEGSPYYTKDFIRGTAYLKNGNHASVPLRYDIFRDEIEFLKENKILLLKKNEILYVLYGSDMLMPIHSVSDTSKFGYFILKSTGNYKLFCRKIIGFYPEVPPVGYRETIPAKFKQESDEFYFQTDGKALQKIKNNKDLKGIFSDNKSALNYIKKEKIKASKSKDLEKLFTYLNNK